jgi:hypothetical protein
LYEKLLLNNIESHLTRNFVIPDTQYGFRAGLSVEHLLIDFTREIYQAFSDKKYLFIDVILLDFSNAFTTVAHDKLFNECNEIGISDAFLDILVDFYKNRKEYVKLNDVKSTFYKVLSGVIQGGVMSPTLFSIFVRDIFKNLQHSSGHQFADDSSILKVIYNEKDVDKLQSDLNRVKNCCDENKLKLNVSKTKHLRISLKKVNLPKYKIDNSDIEEVDEIKYLGVILDHKMSFNLHISSVISKSYKKWALIKKLCSNASGETLLRLYKSYILPILEFSSLSWFANETNLVRIEKVQKRITKFICYKLEKLRPPYKERLTLLKIDSLRTRRFMKRMALIKKIRNKYKFIPQNWLNFFNFKSKRNGTFLEIEFSRIKKYEQHIFKIICNDFNELPQTLRDNIDSLTFLSDVKKFMNL